MQNQINQLEVELVERIYKLFLKKFDGNNSEFARASKCTETTIRRIFKKDQGITVNLLLRMCHALNISPSDLFQGFEIKK